MFLVSVNWGQRVRVDTTVRQSMQTTAGHTCVARHNEGVGASGHLNLRVAEVNDGIIVLEQVDLINACREGGVGNVNFGKTIGSWAPEDASARTWNDIHIKAL